MIILVNYCLLFVNITIVCKLYAAKLLSTCEYDIFYKTMFTNMVRNQFVYYIGFAICNIRYNGLMEQINCF